MTMLAEACALDTILNSDNVELFVVFGVGGLIALTAIIGGTISSIVSTRSREATRRELAAYVAEGSITPDDAVAMINAGDKSPGCGAKRQV